LAEVATGHAPIRITAHAAQQMAKRGIPETTVRAVLANPDRVSAGDRVG
jgi:hypothetical protein